MLQHLAWKKIVEEIEKKPWSVELFWNVNHYFTCFFQRWGGWLGSENGTWISIVSCWKWAHLSSFLSPVQWWKLLPNEMSRTKFGKTLETTTRSEQIWLHCCKNNTWWFTDPKDWRHKSQWKQWKPQWLGPKQFLPTELCAVNSARAHYKASYK